MLYYDKIYKNKYNYILHIRPVVIQRNNEDFKAILQHDVLKKLTRDTSLIGVFYMS